MKTKALFIIIPIALTLGACGKKTADATAAGASTTNSTTNNITNTTTNPTPNPTYTPSAGSCSHPIVAYTQPFTYTKTGTGNVTSTTPSGVIMADQDLRVQIIPNNPGGLNNYGKFSADITLLKNGAEVPGATIHLPAAVSNPNNYRTGLAVGSKSNIADFSEYLEAGNNTYSVKVSNVMTDYTCNTYCVPTNNMYWLWNGYSYSVDYNMLNACKALQCDVGPVTSGRQWSVTIKIETDNTPCLTP